MAGQDESTACPNCGNPNLDVDASSNTVYCKNCGFAVQVDPKTGNVTPVSEGRQMGGGGGGGGAAMEGGGGAAMGGGGGGYPGGKHIFGMDRLTFVLVGTIAAFLIYLLGFPNDLTVFALIEAIVLAMWWMNR